MPKENHSSKVSHPHERRVAVIGGGITGLTVAYDLAKKGVFVEVFEEQEELGGLAAPIRIAGGLVERFYHLTFFRDREILKLLGELGIEDALFWRKTKLGIYHEGRFYPFSGWKDLLRFRPIGLLSRLRFALAIYRITSIKRWEKLDQQRVVEWGRKIAGRPAFDVMLSPLLQKKFGERHLDVSAAWLWGKTVRRAMSRSGFRSEKFGYLKGSFGTVYEALAEAVRKRGGRVHRCRPVTGLLWEAGAVVGVCCGDEELGFDRVVSTIPVPSLLQLLPQAARERLEPACRIEYLGAVGLILALKRPLTEFLWLNVNDPAIPFVVVVEITNLTGVESFGGRSIAYVLNYTPQGDELFSLPDEKILERYLKGLRRLCPSFRSEWIEEFRVERDCYADILPMVGVSRFIPRYASPIPRLYWVDFSSIYPHDKGSEYSVHIAHRMSRIVWEELCGGQSSREC